MASGSSLTEARDRAFERLLPRVRSALADDGSGAADPAGTDDPTGAPDGRSVGLTSALLLDDLTLWHRSVRDVPARTAADPPSPGDYDRRTAWASAFASFVDDTRQRVATLHPVLDDGVPAGERSAVTTTPEVCDVLADWLARLDDHPVPDSLTPLSVDGHEGRIDAGARSEWGQVYTPEPVARLLARWVIRGESETVLDPACGTGRFLTAAYDRQRRLGGTTHDERLERLLGVEYNATPAHLARRALVAKAPRRRSVTDPVVAGDFFERFDDLGPVDAVLTNPPFSRPETVEDSYLDRVRERTAGIGGVSLPSTVGLYAHFLQAVTPIVPDGGRVAAVLPSSAFDADYADALQSFLSDHYDVETVVGTLRHRTVRSADVNTVVVLLTRRRSNDSDTVTRFVGLSSPLGALDDGTDEEESGTAPLRVQQRAPDDDRTPPGPVDATGNLPLADHGTARVRSMRQAALTERNGPLPSLFRHRWTPYLRLSEDAAAVLGNHAGAFDRLGDVATVEYGWKPGAVYFYVVPRPGTEGRYLATEYAGDGRLRVTNNDPEFDGPGTYDVERDCWMRPVEDDGTVGNDPSGVCVTGRDGRWRPRYVLKSSSKLTGPVVDPDDADHVLVSSSVPRRELAARYPGFERHVQWGESRGYHQRQSLADRDPWYETGAHDAGALVLTQFHDERVVHPTNPYRVTLTNTFQQARAPPEARPFLAGYANSTLGALATELFGRTNLGAGALTVYGVDFEDLPVPSFDPDNDRLRNRFSSAVRNLGVVKSITETLPPPGRLSLSDVPERRRRLDRLVFESLLSLSETEQLTLYRELSRLVRERISKAGHG